MAGRRRSATQRGSTLESNADKIYLGALIVDKAVGEAAHEAAKVAREGGGLQ